jgi:hypothetical protein
VIERKLLDATGLERLDQLVRRPKPDPALIWPRATIIEDVPFVVEFRDGGPGVTVLARRISAPRPARTISIITRSRFERSADGAVAIAGVSPSGGTATRGGTA